MFNILIYQGFQAFPLLRWYLPIPQVVALAGGHHPQVVSNSP